MSEKIYKMVSRAGVWNLVLGIIVLVTGDFLRERC